MKEMTPRPQRWAPLGRLSEEEFREVRLALMFLAAERRWWRRDWRDWCWWHLRHLGESWALLRLYLHTALIRLLAVPPQGPRP